MNWKWLNALKFRRTDVEPSRRAFGYSSGVYIHEDSAMQVSAYYRGVVYIASQIAKLPWEIKDKDNRILENQVSRIINICPNSTMSAMSWRLTTIINAINYGNSYSEIQRDGAGRPVALWPIPSSHVDPVILPNGEFVYRIIAGSVENPGEDTILSPQDIFHVRNFHTKDGVIGQGVVAYAVGTLGIALGADRMAGNLFANGGLPSGVLEVEGRMSDEAYLRMKKSWDEAHAREKSGGTAILEEGAKFKAMTMSPDIMQFLESRKFSVLEIARFLGLPPTKLFDTEAATFNNVENSNLEVAVDTLDSWARNLEGEADIKLLNKCYGGNFTEFDIYAISRGDMTTRGNYFKSMMNVGAMTPNEIRRKEGMAPYVDGDRYYIATNNYSPADRVDDIVDAQIASGKPDPEKESPEEKTLQKAAAKYLDGKK